MEGGLLSFIIDFLGSSVVMYGIYVLLFRYKSSYNQTRLFLLAIPFLALLFSIVTLNVLPAPVVAPVATEGISMPDHLTIIPDTEVASSFSAPVIIESVNGATPAINYLLILLCVYGIVALVRLSVLLYNVHIISSAKRWSTPEKVGNELVYRSGYVETPFSFLKTIFVSRKITTDKLQLIVLHEKAHIAHHHYIDKIFIELYTTFMWFNPIVWLIRKELGAVHEFQSDATVIQAGVDLHDYQQLLFDEIEKNVPIVANGFNNSLIKKRFIMMRDGVKNRFPVLRIALLIPLLVTIFAFTSLGYEERRRDVATTAANDEVFSETPKSVVQPSEIAAIDPKEKTPVVESLHEKQVSDQTMKDSSESGSTEAIATAIVTAITTTIAAIPDNVAKIATNATITAPETDNPAQIALKETVVPKEVASIKKDSRFGRYILTPENISYYNGQEHGLVNIFCSEDETKVVLTVAVSGDYGWVFFSGNTFLRDCETGDLYKVRRMESGIPLDEVLYFNGVSGLVQFTMVFPPLTKAVKSIDYIQYNSNKDTRPTKGRNWKFSDIDLSEYPRKTPQVIL